MTERAPYSAPFVQAIALAPERSILELSNFGSDNAAGNDFPQDAIDDFGLF